MILLMPSNHLKRLKFLILMNLESEKYYRRCHHFCFYYNLLWVTLKNKIKISSLDKRKLNEQKDAATLVLTL